MKNKSANEMQVGGDHYKASSGLQHWDLIDTYEVGYLEGCATKYLSRFRKKAGAVDLRKALHYVTKLLEVRERDGFDDKMLPDVPYAAIDKFLFDNGITGREVAHITALLSWRDLDMLRVVILSLENFIPEYEAEEADAGSGYVNQDR